VDLHSHQRIVAMCAFDLFVSDLGEIGVVKRARQRNDQIPVGAFEGRRIGAAMTVALRVKIEITVAQAFELVVVFIVIDRAEQAAEPAEPVAIRRNVKRAVIGQGVQDVDLADGNEVLAFAVNAALFWFRVHDRLAPDRNCKRTGRARTSGRGRVHRQAARLEKSLRSRCRPA